jgi:hypothetical protein
MFVLTKNQAKAKADVLNKFLAERGVTLPASDMLNAIARMGGLEDWNAMAAQFKPEAVDKLLDGHEKAHAWDAEESELRSEETGGEGFGAECQIQTASGFWLGMAAYPHAVDYIRVCDTLGREVAYWSVDEFTEDAGVVLAAVGGALNRSREDRMPSTLNPAADKLVVADRSGKKRSAEPRTLMALPWYELHSLSIQEADEDEDDASHYRLHNPSEYDMDILTWLDAERSGSATPAVIAELDELEDTLVIDWGDENEAEGLSLPELRNAKVGPGKAWTLHDGRILRFYRKECV